MVIRVDDNLVEHLQVTKEGSTLVIGLKPGHSYSLRNVTLEADVTMPELTGADLSSGSHLRGKVDVGDVTFEGAFAELEQLVRQLDEGDLTLDEAVSLYERAQTLARYCQQCLDQAELRVTQLESDASE